jgi:hypothetical protein
MFTEFAAWLQTTPLSVTIQTVHWIIPLIQSIHILTIGVVFVSILMIALRVLGLALGDQPFAEVYSRFAPWIWTGLVVMLVTGITLVIGEPIREFTATSFWVKMALLVVGVASGAAFGRSVRPPKLAAGAEPVFSSGLKSATVVVLLLWVAIIFLGRAIAYDVEVWESLSFSAGT